MIAAVVPRIGALGAVVFALVCCAGLPALGAALGGVTAGVLIGVAGGLISAVVLAAAVILFIRSRRRRVRTESRR
jgi:biotin transporter BioY